jgi:AtzE family amidohydrolase
MTQAPHSLSAAVIAREVRGGRLSAVAVLEATLARLEAVGGDLNAFRVVLAERGLREARAVDALVAAGGDPGPLAGAPFGVKDLYDVAGLATAAGSKISAEGQPAVRDAVLIQRLTAAGAVLFGVQVMDEYAYGFTTENAHHGVVRNPYDRRRAAGGSSGGSAAAVAAGIGAFSLGSDTNGSIRVPASLCGLFGLKPTYGRLPRTGTFPFVFDLDHLGPMARDVIDLALVYDAMQGHDPGDAACAPVPARPVTPSLDAGLEARVAVLGGWFEVMAGAEALAATALAAEVLGAKDRVILPGAEAARSAAFLLTAASGGDLHRDNLTRRSGDFDPATRGRLLAGRLLPAGDILRAQRVRRRFHEEVMAAFAKHQVLIAPATPCSAPLLDGGTIVIGGETVAARANLGLLTQPISAIGLPVVTVPLRGDSGLPIGVQIIAPPWREDLAFAAALRLRRAGVTLAGEIAPCS